MASPPEKPVLSNALKDFLVDHAEIAKQLVGAISVKGSVELQSAILKFIEEQTLSLTQLRRLQLFEAVGEVA